MFVFFAFLFVFGGCSGHLNATRSILFKPYGDEIASRVSDHEMVATRIEFNGQKLTVATYNSWARGSRNGFMNNVGYELRGSEPDVEGRTDENVKRIINFLHENPSSIVALQEWNRIDLLKLSNQLPLQFGIRSMPIKGESFKNALIYNKSQFRFVRARGNDLDFNRLQWATPSESGNQRYRYLHGTLEAKKGNALLEIVNVHLKWKSEPDDIARCVEAIADQFDNFVILGDFNTDLSEATFPGIVKLVSIEGTLVATRNDAQMQTNDAILYRVIAK